MNSCSFGEELQKNKPVQKRLEELNALKQWLSEISHLPSLEKNDLVLFWHRNEYDMAATKMNIEHYFWMRTEMPEFFSHRDPYTPPLVEAMNAVSVVVLPNRTPEGYAIVLLRMLTNDPNRCNFFYAVKYLNMVVDLHVYLEGSSAGYLFVCDIKGVSPSHLDSVIDRSLTNYYEYLREGAHFRWKGIHYVNSSSKNGLINDYVKKQIIRSQKRRSEVYLHKNMTALSKAIPRELFPKEMGGRAGNVNEMHQEQIKRMKDCSAWFKVEERLRVKKEELKLNEFAWANSFS